MAMGNLHRQRPKPAEFGQRDAIGMIRDLLRPELARPVLAPAEAPAGAGAYVLVLRLDEPVAVGLAGRSVSFGPGSYAYSGSAYGPGGIRARLSRHFRRAKKFHWHVDRLTVAASAIAAIAVEGGSECRIAERLAASTSFAGAVTGFGSSDCRTCTTHLLRWLGTR
jgi:Uri superfamily endonuclease